MTAPGSKGAISKSSDARSRATRSCAFATFPATDCNSCGCTTATPQSSRRWQGLRRLLDAVPQSRLDARRRTASVDWTNRAYARAVEAKDLPTPSSAISNCSIARLRGSARRGARRSGVWRRGARRRRRRRAQDVRGVRGRDTGRERRASRSTFPRSRRCAPRWSATSAPTKGMLDQLSTAVAIFDRAKRLIFFNAAYRQIWSLDPAFLEQQPTDGEILDRLRAKRQLPEQADFRTWKAQTLAAYQAIEPIENGLASARRARAARRRQPQSAGRRHLSLRRRDAELRARLATQRADPRAGRDARRAEGRRRRVRRRRADEADQPGLRRAVALRCRARRRPPAYRRGRARLLCRCSTNPALWDGLRATIVGLPEDRRGFEARIERTDGLVLDCAALPLPDGATLITFFDATASANVERALTERNEALVSAEKLRNDFVNHVSYELRTPLTNIIGFTQLLADGGAGPLNPKQIEYAGYIKSSSAALLAIINDILDLASIDAGALELRLEEVDVVEAMEAAAEGVQDRLSESQIDLRIVATDGVGSLRADGRRVRQVLFNLLSNAIGFSEAGQTVTLGRDAPRRRSGVQGVRSRPRHRAGGAGARVRSLRKPYQRLAPSRPRPRPLDRARAGRTARRAGDDRFGARRRHDGDLHFSGRGPRGAWRARSPEMAAGARGGGGARDDRSARRGGDDRARAMARPASRARATSSRFPAISAPARRRSRAAFCGR